MARSIVLRFDATCFDCGSPIPAGATARWFGKGRVSCCGAGAPAGAAPAVAPPSRPTIPPRGWSLPQPSSVGDAVREQQRAAANAAHADDVIVRAAADAGVTPDRLANGLTPHDVDTVARNLPAMLLLVRLSSGARFLVPAEHARHVIRCIEESLVDRVRDVTRSPNQ